MRPVQLTAMRKACLVLAAALFLFASYVSAQQVTELRDAIAAALQAQEFEKALELLGPAIRQFPNHAEFWAMQGMAYEGAGNKKEALASFHRSLQISPDYLPALQGAAQIEYEAGSASAIPLIRRVLRLRPNDQTGHGMLAVLEYQRGHCAAAVPHFEKAGSLFDAQVAALHAYGVCLVRLRKFEDAVAVLQRSVTIQREDALERRLLASVQLMAAKPQDALDTLKPLLQSNRGDPDTLELAATAYEDASETSQAVSTLRQAILLNPHNVNLYLDFAHICYAHDSFQVGIDVLSDGIEQQPTAAPLFLARGVLYVQLAEYQKAEADFEKAHELDPRQSLSSAAQGVAALQENDLDRALATVQGKLSKKPNDALLLYLQADFLLQKGATSGSPEFRIAMRSASKAVTLQPSLAEARTVLAKLYLQSGKYPQAIDQCRKALENDPKNQAAVYHLIQALRKTGRTGEIPDLLKRLAQLREQAAKEESHRNRYKLVEEESQPSKPVP